ncbi:hypothetical protein BLOT_012739 [Blomia tropicalis]|nr:hypothetical protein BLOT_012739 [Blomia tropicalis]
MGGLFVAIILNLLIHLKIDIFDHSLIFFYFPILISLDGNGCVMLVAIPMFETKVMSLGRNSGTSTWPLIN